MLLTDMDGVTLNPVEYMSTSLTYTHAWPKPKG